MMKEGEILYSNLKAIPRQVMMGGLLGVVFAQTALCSVPLKANIKLPSANEGTHRSRGTMLV